MVTKRISSFKGIKRGQKFRVIGNAGGHNYPLGKVFTFKRDMVSASGSATDIAEEVQYGNNIYASDIELVITQTLDELKKEKSDLEKRYKKEIAELEEKIKVCEENGLEEFDEDFAKVYKILKVVEGKKTRTEKAKVITQLLKG